MNDSPKERVRRVRRVGSRDWVSHATRREAISAYDCLWRDSLEGI